MNTNPYDASHESPAAPIQRRPVWSILAMFVAAVCIVVLLIGLMLPAVRTARPAAWRMRCSNNLKQIALALRNYESAYESLPPAYTVDASGKRLHSWRVLILPFLEEEMLYESIDLTKSWDDPVNLKTGSRMPSIYDCPASVMKSNETTYKVIVAPDSCFPLTEGRRLSEITDGLSDTVMLIETSPDTAVHWMSPNDADLEFLLGFGSETQLAHHSGIHGVFADGSTLFLSEKMPEDLRRAIVSVNGGEDLSDLLD